MIGVSDNIGQARQADKFIDPGGPLNVIEQEFNALAGEYETNRLAPWYKAHAAAILRECPSHIDGEILDVGCGTGYLLRSLLERHPGVRGVGLDLSGAMIEEAERLAVAESVDNADFVRADWESMDLQVLAGHDFSLAICANAFHYFSDPRAAAGKLFDVLAPGGSLLVLERNKSNSPMTQLWGWLHRHVIKDNVEFYDLDQLLALFRAAGFIDVGVIRKIRRAMWKNKLYTDVVLIKCVKG